MKKRASALALVLSLLASGAHAQLTEDAGGTNCEGPRTIATLPTCSNSEGEKVCLVQDLDPTDSTATGGFCKAAGGALADGGTTHAWCSCVRATGAWKLAQGGSGGGGGGSETDPVYLAQKGAANGAATLDGTTHVPDAQLPANVSRLGATIEIGEINGGDKQGAGGTLATADALTPGNCVEAGSGGKLVPSSGPCTASSTTASNVGDAGVGPFNAKVGADLQFRNIAPGAGIAVTHDVAGKNVVLAQVPCPTAEAYVAGICTNIATQAELDAHTHTAAAIVNTPSGGVAATDVQGAIDELDAEKQSAAGTSAWDKDASDDCTLAQSSNCPAGSEFDPVYLAQKGAANGVATLDGSSLIPDAQIPANVSRLGSSIDTSEIAAGSKTGNGAKVATAGTLAVNECLHADANGNVVSTGADCNLANVTASNLGNAGTGVFDFKSGNDLGFRNITGGNGVTVTYDSPNKNIGVAQTPCASGMAYVAGACVDVVTQTEGNTYDTNPSDDCTPSQAGNCPAGSETDPVAAPQIAAHLADTTDAHAGSAITNTPAGTIAATTVQAAINELATEKVQTETDPIADPKIDAHIADTTAAHAASAISNAPSGNVSSTDVQGAINELVSEKIGTETDPIADPKIDAHIADTSAAHAGSAISNTPAGTVAATDVQGAINEIASEKLATESDPIALSQKGAVNGIASLDSGSHVPDAQLASNVSRLGTDITTSEIAAASKQGTGSKVATTNSLTNSKCVETDSGGNLVSAAAACGTGGGDGQSLCSPETDEICQYSSPTFGPTTIQYCNPVAGTCYSARVPENVNTLPEPVNGCNDGGFSHGKPVVRCAGDVQRTVSLECDDGEVRVGANCEPYSGGFSAFASFIAPEDPSTQEQACSAINSDECATVLGAEDTVNGAVIHLRTDDGAALEGSEGAPTDIGNIVVDTNGDPYALQVIAVGAGNPDLEHQTVYYYPNVPFDSRCDGGYHGKIYEPNGLTDGTLEPGDIGPYNGCSHLQVGDTWDEGVKLGEGGCLGVTGTEPDQYFYEDLDCNQNRTEHEPYIGTIVKEDGVELGQERIIDFTGNGITCVQNNPAGQIECDVPAGSGHTIRDEGNPQTAYPNLNFVGAGITCTGDGPNSETECTVPAISFDTDNNGSNESSAVTKIICDPSNAVVCTEPTPDVLKIAMNVSAFCASCSDCSLGGGTTFDGELACLYSGTNCPATGGDLSGAIGSATVIAASTTQAGKVELAVSGENAANVVVQGNDTRLTDARAPTAHASTHIAGGSDQITSTASRCARFDGSGHLTAASGDCSAGDTGGGGGGVTLSVDGVPQSIVDFVDDGDVDFGVSGGDVTAVIKNDAVTTNMIFNSTITTSDLADAAVTAPKVAADAINALTQVDQGIKTAANDTSKLVVGTAGATDDCAKWSSTGTLISAGAACGSGGGGSSIILDLGDDAGNDSTALAEIATTGDTNNIVTESSADKALFNMANDWPKSDQTDVALTGDSATAFFSAGTIEAARLPDADDDATTKGIATFNNTQFDATTGSVTIATGGIGTTEVAALDTADVTTGTWAAARMPALTGDVTTSSGAVATTIGADKILETMLKAVNSPTDEYVLTYETTTGDFEWQAQTSGGAPTGVDYLVGTADGTLSNEIVVGTTPGGILGGTWASPTLDNDTVGLLALAGNAGTPQSFGDFTCSDAACSVNGNAITTGKIADGEVGNGDLANTAVTYAKMQNIATDTLIGRDTTSSGSPETISLGSGFSMSGSQVLNFTESDAAHDTCAEISGCVVGAITTETGDISSVYGCANGACTSIALGATDFLDMSATDSSTTTEGLKLPQHASLCAGGTAEGQVCWEADANILHIGDSAALKDFISTSAFSGDATVSSTGTVAIQADSVALGTDTTNNYVASVATTSPLSGGAAGSEGAAISLSIADAAADGATKGAAAFNATRFSAASGVVDIASVAGITGANEDSVSLADVQTATTSDFHNIGGTDDDTPESGDFTNLTGGNGITNTAGTLATASNEQSFLLDVAALTCGSSTKGELALVDGGTVLNYCDDVATPAPHYLAIGTSSGNASNADNLEGVDFGILTNAKVCTYSSSATEVVCNSDDDDIPDAADYTNLTAGLGMVNSPTGTLAFKMSDTLSGNPAYNAKECTFTTDGTSGGGFICEGTTASNNIEQEWLFPQSTLMAAESADATNFFPFGTSEGIAQRSTVGVWDNGTKQSADVGGVDFDTGLSTSKYKACIGGADAGKECVNNNDCDDTSATDTGVCTTDAGIRVTPDADTYTAGEEIASTDLPPVCWTMQIGASTATAGNYYQNDVATSATFTSAAVREGWALTFKDMSCWWVKDCTATGPQVQTFQLWSGTCSAGDNAVPGTCGEANRLSCSTSGTGASNEFSCTVAGSPYAISAGDFWAVKSTSTGCTTGRWSCSVKVCGDNL